MKAVDDKTLGKRRDDKAETKSDDMDESVAERGQGKQATVPKIKLVWEKLNQRENAPSDAPSSAHSVDDVLVLFLEGLLNVLRRLFILVETSWVCPMSSTRCACARVMQNCLI